MKRILISAVLSLCAAMTFAIPAKKSWKVVSQSDGITHCPNMPRLRAQAWT